MGWSGAAAATALLLATLYAALARGLLRDSRSPLIVIVVTILATGIGAVHFLVRIHLFTFVFFLGTLHTCQRQHESGGWVIGIVPVLMVLWAHVHGGFLEGRWSC